MAEGIGFSYEAAHRDESIPVLIVGAGPAGLTASLLLAQVITDDTWSPGAQSAQTYRGGPISCSATRHTG